MKEKLVLQLILQFSHIKKISNILNIFILILAILSIFLNFSCKKNVAKDRDNIRIVSLTPSITRILFHLNVGDKIAGVTDYCDVQNELFTTLIKEGKIERVGGFYNPNIEKIIYINPTLIFGMDSFSYETKIKLDNLFGNRIHWYKHPKTYQEITEQIMNIATILKKSEEGNLIVESMNNKVDEIHNKITNIENRKKILVEIYSTPFTTCGKNTFIASIVKNSGGILAFNLNDDWPTPTIETIIATDFDLVLKTHIADNNNPIFYKNRPIFIPKDISFYLQPGVESVYAIEELYNFLYENNSL